MLVAVGGRKANNLVNPPHEARRLADQVLPDRTKGNDQ
jgi:hypothetical protein